MHSIVHMTSLCLFVFFVVDIAWANICRSIAAPTGRIDCCINFYFACLLVVHLYPVLPDSLDVCLMM